MSFKTLTSALVLTTVMSFSVSAFSEDIPVSRVILSTGGLAHFEHEIKVDGNEHLQLPVRLDQVDDLLKSLVVFDEKGHIGSVTLPGRQPLSQVFRDMPFSQGVIMSSPVLLLNAYQGAEITIKGLKTSKEKKDISGKLLNVIPENVGVSDNGAVVQKNRLSILTENGLEQFLLDDLGAVYFNDIQIRKQIDRALSAIRTHSTQDIRTLDISLKGEGVRDVTLSYVVEAPLWKSSYRLVLPKDDKDEAFIQGWAVVENMTNNDWKNVDLSLVSGNPVTYHQALYQSYHVSRPELPVEILGRIMPRVDTGTMSMADGSATPMKKASVRREANVARFRPMFEASDDMKGAMAPMPVSIVSSNMPMEEQVMKNRNMASIAHMKNAAQSAEATTQVLFRFPNKFNLGVGQSMMVPFVSQKVPVEKISLYQPDTHPTHPLASVRLKNDGESGLPSGILTLYEESDALKGIGFVGDAQLPILGAGEERLVSYALDSKTQIEKKTKSTQRQDKITISKGVMRTAVKYVSSTSYKIKAPAKQKRVVMIEQPKMHDYILKQPSAKETEVTATHYRIKVSLKAGEVKNVKVVLERDAWQSAEIRHLSIYDLKAYASTRGKLSSKIRSAFEKMAVMRANINTEQQNLNRLENFKRNIFNDQNRIRENIKSLSGKSSVKSRYLDKLDKQEEQLEDIEDDLKDVRARKLKRTRELEQYIMRIRF